MTQKPEIKNYMEFRVQNELEKIMKEMDCCICNKCKLDAMAIALNALPPKYIVTSKGNIYAKLDAFQSQSGVDVTAAIATAVSIVKAHPEHDLID